jgi:hypothetical protein
MRKLPFSMDRPTSARLRYARMATTGMPLTHARLTAITDLIILPGACLLARVHGFMASTVAAVSTAGGADTMAVAGAVIVTDSVARAAGMAVVNSTGTGTSTAAEASMVEKAFVEVTLSTVAAGSMEAVVSTAEAGPTAEGTGSC